MTLGPEVRDKLKGALAFFHHVAAGGLLLLGAAVAALGMLAFPDPALASS